MHKREGSSHQIIILLQILLLLQFYVISIDTGASSTPKNLVNLYTPNESLNLTSSNQFQNEYQYRQSASKSTSSDRNKSSTPTLTDASFDHLSNDLSNPSALDYSYQDNRAMTNVPDCKGRLKLNGTRGYITDGPGYYQTNLQCIWLIDSGRNNSTIRIQFHQFNTECNYDFLYIFDGDSIYSPLVAALSGDMKDFSNTVVEANFQDLISSNENHQTNFTSITSPINQGVHAKGAAIQSTPSESRSFEFKTSSGKAFIYFHSDTAQSMPGFYMTYSIDSCPLDCSNRGECDYTNLICRCNSGYFGDGCQHVLCPNNCTSPLHGTCDKEKSCICHKDFTGHDCSKRASQQSWVTMADSEKKAPPRAFHQVSIVDNIMWVFGGRSHVLSDTNMGILRHKKTQIIFSFDLEKKTWTDNITEGVTGEDHLAELSGHSIATHGNKVFIYGGMAMNNSILNALSVFDTRTHALISIANGKKMKNQEEEFLAPLAVVGHSANIIDGYMYVFLGYNPLYGYLNFAQKLNLANNSWSIIERRGSSISGCIGHTSTFDPPSRLVYIYGGHNALRSNKLYSFDPRREIWTFLQAAPSHRYYHSSLIMNGQLLILGGNSYNTSHQSDQCFQQTYLIYDLRCSEHLMNGLEHKNFTSNSGCGRKCWSSIEDNEPSILKRHGHTVVAYDNRELILFGGFNGILMNDIRYMMISSCSNFTTESECNKLKPALNCFWDVFNLTCKDSAVREAQVETYTQNCTANEVKALQAACEARGTCTDCLNTNFGCVWCGFISQCQYSKCRSLSSKAILDPDLCYKDEFMIDSIISRNTSLPPKNGLFNQEQDNEMDCKLDNCYLCQSRPQCSWQNDGCIYSTPSVVPSMVTGGLSPQEDPIDNPIVSRPSILSNSTRFMQKLDPFNRSFLAALTTSLLNSSPYTSCDVPCFMRRSCNECTTTKCIWCSTTEQCVDSSAYFAYHTMGQCMHYVAHMLKCPVASCADIESCDKCLTNPKCGWLNDISNTGKGKCIEGDSSGPSFGSNSTPGELSTHTSITPTALPNWYYTSCPSCQCNGHSHCKPNSSVCVQPCQDNTEGAHCDRCVPGHFGDPINGGPCRPCRCNGHAQTCNRETGKCYCSVKGIIGHNCNRCDDKNYYIGDPSSPNGTCYYNLTTDYQYTFNMSKPEDHFYSEINFINVPLRKESDADFSIACSRLALVNITSGTSYKNRRPVHTGLECGSFRLRFPHDRHNFTEANYSLFVHVYKFQTPFILQIAFSQQRTLYLPQFFFTFLR